MNARKVATTMRTKLTDMNPGQGFTANAVTALLVIVASHFGIPVSTTHVSCGSPFGLGAVPGGARWNVIRDIILACIATLSAGALFDTIFVFAAYR